MRAAIYARYSSDLQSAASIEDQIRRNGSQFQTVRRVESLPDSGHGCAVGSLRPPLEVRLPASCSVVSDLRLKGDSSGRNGVASPVDPASDRLRRRRIGAGHM